MAEFERGDLVVYTPRRVHSMNRWYYLEGRVGIVVDGPRVRLDDGLAIEAYDVEWIVMDTQEKQRAYYHRNLLEKVGHIDIP